MHPDAERWRQGRGRPAGRAGSADAVAASRVRLAGAHRRRHRDPGPGRAGPGARSRDAIDWPRLDIWWGDERFLPAGDPERNETGARAALLDHVGIDPARVHPMPASDGPDGDDPEAAAARYAAELRAAARPGDHGAVPSFDVLLLGIGPEGHVASLFPGLPAVYERSAPWWPSRGSPKPPPTRLSLTFPAIQARPRGVDPRLRARRRRPRWPGRCRAPPRSRLPAAGARGQQQTLFLLDRAAAAQLPPELYPGP